eukprot:2697380-Rhodomonas_salina.3
MFQKNQPKAPKNHENSPFARCGFRGQCEIFHVKEAKDRTAIAAYNTSAPDITYGARGLIAPYAMPVPHLA